MKDRGRAFKKTSFVGYKNTTTTELTDCSSSNNCIQSVINLTNTPLISDNFQDLKLVEKRDHDVMRLAENEFLGTIDSPDLVLPETQKYLIKEPQIVEFSFNHKTENRPKIPSQPKKVRISHFEDLALRQNRVSKALSFRKRENSANKDAKRYSKLEQIEIIKGLEKSNNKSITQMTTLIKKLNIILSTVVFLNLVLTMLDIALVSQIFQEYFKSAASKEKNIDDSKITDKEIEDIGNLDLDMRHIYLQISNLITIGIILYLLVKIYQTNLEIQKYYFYCTEEDTLYSSGLYKYMLIEMILLAVCNPPFKVFFIRSYVNGVLHIYTINTISSCLMVLKIYVFIRVFSEFSKWTNDDNTPVCNKYFGNPGASFTVRATYKQSPLEVIAFCFLLSMSYFGLFLYSFDLGVFYGNELDGYMIYHINFSDSLWLVLESCTTVGYGEYTPKTLLARIMGISSALFGWFFISLLILVAQELLAFDEEEENSFIQIKKRSIFEETEDTAADVIVRLLQMRLVLVEKERKLHKFLLDNPNYQINFFYHKFSSNNDSGKKKKTLIFNEGEEELKLIPHYFLRFYNKLSCFNALTLASIRFQRKNRILKSYFPHLEQMMANVTESVDKNYIKMDDYVTNKTKYILDEFKDLAQDVSLNTKKQMEIKIISKKIADLVLKLNNSRTCVKNSN